MWWPGWEQQLLAAIGAPNTPANVSWLDQWALQEEPSASAGYANNPLNVAGPGGIMQFPSASAGIAATAAFMQKGYQSIIADLQTGAPKNSFPGVASDLSWWSGGGGNVPPSKGYDAITGFGAATGSTSGGSGFKWPNPWTPPSLLGPNPAGAVNDAIGQTNAQISNVVPSWVAALLQPWSDWWKAHPIGLLLIGLALVGVAIAVISTDKNVQGAIAAAPKAVPVPV